MSIVYCASSQAVYRTPIDRTVGYGASILSYHPVQIINHYPIVSGQIRCWPESLPIGDLVEFLIRDFKGGVDRNTAHADYEKHLPSHAKTEIVSPFYILGHGRQPGTDIAEIVDVICTHFDKLKFLFFEKRGLTCLAGIKIPDLQEYMS